MLYLYCNTLIGESTRESFIHYTTKTVKNQYRMPTVTHKQIARYKNVREKIIKAVDTIADPIRETMSPMGRNVLLEDQHGNFYSTNDGVTIAKSITVKDPVENMIVQLIKAAAAKTNTEAGDGTSTSILLTQVLIKEGFKMIDNGWNEMELKKAFDEFGKKIVAKLKKEAVPVKSDKDIFNIAHISANNDKEIAKVVQDVVKSSGIEGMVFLEPNNKVETEIERENGFVLDIPLMSPDLSNGKNKFAASYANVPVFITDKRIYHQEEAETILTTVIENGYKSVVIVAPDFIGQSPAVFIANHLDNVCQVLLVKVEGGDKDSTTLNDLATYLGGKVVSEKKGKLVDSITMDNFVMAGKVFASGKTIFTSKKKKNGDLAMLITSLREEIKKKKDDESLKERLAHLTNSVATVKVGAATALEQKEKMFRFEDAINATRAAMKDGILVGGGIALKNAFDKKEHPQELSMLFRRYCEANVRQIAENCGLHAETVLETINTLNGKHMGYNALSGTYEDLLKSGVIDPYKVTEMAVLNSISIAGQIISSNTLIVNEIDYEEDK